MENLIFKGGPVIPDLAGSHPTNPLLNDPVWREFTGICVDCPPTWAQLRYSRKHALRSVHYQHWTSNGNETYEQMVGDECYEGINS